MISSPLHTAVLTVEASTVLPSAAFFPLKGAPFINVECTQRHTPRFLTARRPVELHKTSDFVITAAFVMFLPSTVTAVTQSDLRWREERRIGYWRGYSGLAVWAKH